MRTKDYGLASLLVCKDFKLQRRTKDQMGQVWFEFGDTEDLLQIENEFYSNDAYVLVQDYLAALKRIKSLIYQTRNNEYEYEYENNRSIS